MYIEEYRKKIELKQKEFCCNVVTNSKEMDEVIELIKSKYQLLGENNES